jgi:hypothetical protein
VLAPPNEFSNRGKLTGKLANSFSARRLNLAWSDREIARHCQVSQWFVSRLRKGASDNECQMKPRKVKRGNTVYEMQARTKNGQKSDDAAQTLHAAAPACDRVGLPLPAGTAAAFACAGDFEAADQLHLQLAALVDQLAQGAGGAAYRQHVVRKVRDGKITFSSPELAPIPIE